MMKLAMFLLTVVPFVTGCAAQSPQPPAAGSASAEGKIVVTGKITDEGVECLAMRGDDGKLYTLGRPNNPPKAGQRVRVTGTIAQMSICMQGTTIAVEKIELL